MDIRLKTFRIGQAPICGEGIRLGVVRYLPRGVKKADYRRLGYFDLWFPVLAPSRELLRKARQGGGDFSRRYRSELLGNSERRQVLRFLAEVSRKIPISIGCYCEDESRCHRSVLASLIRAAAAGRLPE